MNRLNLNGKKYEIILAVSLASLVFKMAESTN